MAEEEISLIQTPTDLLEIENPIDAKARQWLVANAHKLMVDLSDVVPSRE